MMFEGWISGIATILGISTTATAILMSFIFTAIIIVLSAAVKLHSYAQLLIFICCTAMFTAVGWIPVWLMLIIGIAEALAVADYLSKRLKGGGE